MIVCLIYNCACFKAVSRTASRHAKLVRMRQQIQVLVHSIGRHSAVDALNVNEAQGSHVSNIHRYVQAHSLRQK
jgi:formate dehydrogenase assembly factor FdhD